MLEPPPPKFKKIRRAYSFNRKGVFVLRPAPVFKKRPRTFSYRKPNQNFSKISVKRGTQELTGQDRRTRIYEILYFIPTTVMKALTPKQLELLLQAHRCAICQKVFRLSSGVKFHMQDNHENRTLLSFFKKTEDVNNIKEKERSQALDEHTSENDKNNQSVLVRKPSVKNFFNVRKPPRYIAKPLGLTRRRCRTNNNKNKSPEREEFTPLTPLLDNVKKTNKENERSQALDEHTPENDKNDQNVLVRKPSVKNFFNVRKPPRCIAKPLGLTPRRCKTNNNKNKSPEREEFTPLTPLLHKSSTLEKEQTLTENTKVGTSLVRKPKLMTRKKWQKKYLEEMKDSGNQPVDERVDGVEQDTPPKDEEAASPAVSLNCASPATPGRPKLMTPKNWRKRVEALTPQKNKSPSPEIPSTATNYKPKLMTHKTWRSKKLSPADVVNPNENISDDKFVKEKFDLTLDGPSLLDKGAQKVLNILRVLRFYSKHMRHKLSLRFFWSVGKF